MQIKGEEFLKKVQLQQEREELERKLSEIEEARSSIGNNSHQSYSNNTVQEENDNELDNIMLNTSIGNNEENKKKYLILAIVLVILFLLTIIIIRLLTNNPNKNDQFTAGSTPTDMKKMPESGNIEENYQKIMNDRLKNDSTHSASQNSTDDRLKALQQQVNDNQLKDIKEENSGGVSNEALEETMKKIEEKRTTVKEKTTDSTAKKTTVAKEEIAQTVAKTKEKQKEVVEKKTETTKSSVKDLMNTTTTPKTVANTKTVSEPISTSTTSGNGYFIQVGAFSKKPTDSYLSNIKSANLKYKIQENNINGSTYHKVLIGPYNSKEAANEAVSSVKQKLNVASAFVVKF